MAGTARVALTATAYYLDSDNALAESVRQFQLDVAPGKGSSDLLADIWGWVTFFWDSAVHIAAGLGTIVALFVGHLAWKAARRDRAATRAAEDGTGGCEEPPSRRPDGEPDGTGTPATGASAAAPHSS
ncbi:hypothetical protein [Streptomyces sp. NPDC047071]|uniref:hypothetical protein n=1 Tax=Streptomyces sp. NPDC047071 TaxID=3154808 RepID=UPI0034543B18